MNQTARYTCCLAVLGLFSLLIPVRLLQVTGNSMEPTLRNGQRYLLDRFYFRATGLGYNDIVVARHGGEEIVKRVKGLPGELLQEDLLPDGSAFSVVNLTRQPDLRRPRMFYRRVLTVPPDTVYLVGDNTYVSEDSRRFGPLPANAVEGVVRQFTFSRYFPLPRRTFGPRRARGS